MRTRHIAWVSQVTRNECGRGEAHTPKERKKEATLAMQGKGNIIL